MSKNKLAKFAEMASYNHVIEAPFQTPDTPYHPLRGKWSWGILCRTWAHVPQQKFHRSRY